MEFNKFYLILRNLKFNQVVKLLLKRFFSISHYYILKRNLTVSNDALVKTRLMVRITKAEEEDLRTITEVMKLLDHESRKEIIIRLLFYKAGFRNCYIARAGDNIAYMQWIIYPFENTILEKIFKERFYPLSEGQVMVENAFTFPKYRGLGLLPFVTSKLLNIAKESGFKSAIAYIRKDNIAALNEFIRIGFKITKLVREYKILGWVKRTL